MANFELRAGEILAVIGDNGAGKSTMIKAMCGAIIPDEGEVQLDGQTINFKSPMQARNAGIETVYQNLALSPAIVDCRQHVPWPGNSQGRFPGALVSRT